MPAFRRLPLHRLHREVLHGAPEPGGSPARGKQEETEGPGTQSLFTSSAREDEVRAAVMASLEAAKNSQD